MGVSLTPNAAPDLSNPLAPAGTGIVSGSNIGGVITNVQPGAPPPLPIAGQPALSSDGADYVVVHHGITGLGGVLLRMGDKFNSATDLPIGADIKWLLRQGAIALLDVAVADPKAADPTPAPAKGK